MIRPADSPSSVEEAIARFAKRRQRIDFAAALARYIVVSLLLLLPLSCLLSAPWGSLTFVRLVTAVVTWTLLAILAGVLIGPSLRRRPLMAYARDLEKAFPTLDERLTTALTPDPPGPFAASFSLRGRVGREALLELTRLAPHELFPTHALRRWTFGALAVMVFWAVLFSAPLTRRSLAAGIYRLTQPWESRLPDSLADLTAQPGNVTLLEGDDLRISATAAADHLSLAITPDSGPQTLRPMKHAGRARWQFNVNDVRESFRYRILTDSEDTPWFRATVILRPSIESLTIRYDFPAYTALAPRTVTALGAPIDALAGTRVTLTFRASQALDAGKSRVLLDPPQSPTLLTLPQDRAYQAAFNLDRDGNYAFDLVSPDGIHSLPHPAQKMIARADQVPSIVLLSPDEGISARPDDAMPVQFLASDDFAVTRIDAMIRVDQQSPQTRAVPFDHSDLRHVAGPDYPLLLATVLSNSSDADHEIELQLSATDNRAPAPQSASSALRHIHIDPHQSRSYQGQLDDRLGHSLTDVIANTIKELDLAKPRLLQSKTRDGSEPLGDWQRRELHTAARDLPATATRLRRSAAQPADLTFVPITRAMTQIADGPLRTAAEQAVRADLNADEFTARNDAIARAVTAINQARDALQKLLDSGQIEQRRALAEAIRDLAAAEQLQRASHDNLRRNELPMAAALQARAAQRFDQAKHELPSLRDKPSQRLAQRLEDMNGSLHDLASKAQNASQAQERLKELADASAAVADALHDAAAALNLTLTAPTSSPQSPPGTSGAIAGSPSPAPPSRTATGPLPASIRDLGISPDQWLKLSPSQQRDILSSSQQQGPPAYRPLIQDYYVKVSQMAGESK